jgi:hypothetical protein
MPKTPEQQVEDFLAKVPKKQQISVVAANADLAAALAHFMKLKGADDPRAHVTLNWFYNNVLRDKFDGPCITTVKNYVRDFLKVDFKTGKRL